MKLLLGTTNQAKLADCKKYLRHAELELVTLPELGVLDEPLEIGQTYLENASLKARFYSERTEYPTLGDDGGFEVDALLGKPGLESRRWVGPSGTDEDRIQKVFRLLEGIPARERTARFRVVIVVYFPHEREQITAEGMIEGIVPIQPSDARIPHFPYRSCLFLPKFRKYLAELNRDELAMVAHRKFACQELLRKLEPYLYA